MPSGERLDVRHARTRLIVKELQEAGQTLRLPPEEAAHARARRLAPGDTVVLLDGSGREATAEVLSTARAEVVLRVLELRRPDREENRISLFVAGLRAERLGWLVEKATELGAAQVVLVITRRTQSFRASGAVLPRLERVARAAAKQCGRSGWPTILGPVELERVLEEDTWANRLFLDPGGVRLPSRLARRPTALLVGPEGGWTDSERKDASDRGWTIAKLPAGKLRAETAAVAGLVMLRAALARDSD